MPQSVNGLKLPARRNSCEAGTVDESDKTLIHRYFCYSLKSSNTHLQK